MQSATTDFQLLSVFDVSGSMNEKVGDTTRVKITQEAAGIALSALPGSTKLGLWVFSSDKGPNGADYKEIVPIGTLSDEQHRGRMAAAATSLNKEVEGWTGLYDTIWAAYQKVQANFDPERQRRRHPHGRQERGPGRRPLPRSADGQHPQRHGPQEAHRHHDDRHRPGRRRQGAAADLAGSFSDFYGAASPADMTTVLAKALFDHECTDGVCV